MFNWRYLLLLTLAAAFWGFLFGYETAVITGAIGFLRSHFGLSAGLTGWAASSVLIGCMLGALLGGPLGDSIGPSKTFWMYSLCSLVTMGFVITSV
jgi:MFS family permease